MDEREHQIIAQAQEVEQQIQATTQEAITTLQKSEKNLLEKLKAIAQQKLQVLYQQREVAENNHAQQKNFQQEEEQQVFKQEEEQQVFIQEEEQQVFKQEEEHRTMELMKAASLLPPLEEANIEFTINKKMLSECGRLGEVNFSLNITSQVVTKGEGRAISVAGQELGLFRTDHFIPSCPPISPPPQPAFLQVDSPQQFPNHGVHNHPYPARKLHHPLHSSCPWSPPAENYCR